MNLLTIFLTGLFTGGLTCLAVQGGLLTATLAQRQQDELVDKAKKTGYAVPILAFLAAKIVAYTILGFLLGLLGSFFQLSVTTKVVLQLGVSVFMIGTALNLLSVHPIFRYFVIQPPKFLYKLARNQSKSSSLFAPVFLGALTIFIPCGTTQAMMALAIGASNPFLGAAILFAFILGTSPLFFILGYFTTRLSQGVNSTFTKFAAITILVLALFNIDAALSLGGVSVTPGSILRNVWCTVSICKDSKTKVQTTTASEYTINLKDYGYVPNSIAVKKGDAITLNLVNDDAKGCIQSFVIPKLNIQKVVRTGTKEIVQFTAPNTTGEFTFTCGMGMYRGIIKVV